MSEGGQPSVAGPRATAPIRNSHDFYGGVTLVVLAAIALILSLLVRNTTMFGPVMMPRLFAILVLLAGAAMVTGRMTVRAPQDFYGGVALVGLAVVAMLASNELPGQRGFAFGPGTAPRLFATLLATLGCVISLIGIFVQGPPLERYKVRGVIFITGAILIFAACIRPLGLVIASFSCIVSCAAADAEVRWRETIVWAIILTTFCSFLFPYGLNLPFQLWPRQWL